MSNTMTMTRRSLLATASAASVVMLVACGSSADESAQQTAEPTAQDDQASGNEPADAGTSNEASSTGSKVLVAYFSRADENYGASGKEMLEVGHTKVMAGYIKEALGADEYEIVPTQAYPVGYDDCCDVAKQEQADDTRPAIANALPDVTGYDTVFLGCPIWWGYEPMIIRTFLEGVNLAGKTIVPFTTHAGSGLGSVPSNLQTALPDATVLEGYAVEGTSVDGAREEVVNWAKGLNLA